MEFDNLQIEIPINDESSPMFAAKIFEKKYKNKKDFVVGFNPNDEEFLERKKRRANRFGAPDKETNEKEEGDGVAKNETIKEKPKSATFTGLDDTFFKTVDLKNVKWPPVLDCALDEMRLDAIHLYGVNHMSTKDIFKYFDLFGPDTLEWIDDSSCNVIWEDEATVSKVMDTMSKTFSMIKELQKENETTSNNNIMNGNLAVTIKVEEEDDGNVIDVDANDNTAMDDDEIDPKDVWRVGYPFDEYQLFLRPATVNDKKLPGAASRSEYYLVYGKSENKKKTPGFLSKSRKRKLQEMKNRANQVYKLKEPDVKIVALEELAKEGLVSKMEVEDEEPKVKRMNFHSDNENASRSRMMMADRLDMAQRLGKRFDDLGNETRVHDRLGFPDDYSHDDPSRMNDLRKRLSNNKSSVHDRLGKRDRSNRNEDLEDARGEIERSKRSQETRLTRRHYRADGYVKDGVYHDIYRADDDIKEESPAPERRSRSDNTEDNRRSAVKSRVGNVNLSDHRGGGDLRNKLRGRGEVSDNGKDNGKLKERVKEEEDVDRLNLCIEVKQEPELDYDDDVSMDGEFEF